VSWEDNAECRTPPGLTAEAYARHVRQFYPGRGANGGPEPGIYYQHLWDTYCGPCTVRAECLNDSIRYEDRSALFGYRAGLTAEARRIYLRDRRKLDLCERCGQPYRKSRAGHRYCSRECQRVA